MIDNGVSNGGVSNAAGRMILLRDHFSDIVFLGCGSCEIPCFFI